MSKVEQTRLGSGQFRMFRSLRMCGVDLGCALPKLLAEVARETTMSEVASCFSLPIADSVAAAGESASDGDVGPQSA